MKRIKRVLVTVRVFWRKIGFYVSLAVLLCLVGAAAYTIRTGTPGLPPKTPTASPVPGQVAQDAPAAATLAEKFPPPLERAEVLAGYSPTEPVWSGTLLEWHVHGGIDFAAPAGEAVSAVADGTVVRAEKDPLLGYLVEIAHADGLTTLYASLMGPGLVRAGDRVNQGDAIGGVGSSAAIESAEAPHLHFEAYRMGVWAEILEHYP